MLKFLVLPGLLAALLWVLSIAWSNRRKSSGNRQDGDGGSSGDLAGTDSGGNYSSHDHDSTCDGGGD